MSYEAAVVESVAETSMNSKELDGFIYLLSHDVRTAMRALIEIPQWIEEDLAEAGHPVDGAIADHFDLLNKNARRLDRMLVDLLVYSRVARMQSVELVDMTDVIEQVKDTITIPPSFRLFCDFKAAALHLGARDALTLVTNLVANAIRHHDKDFGTVHISTHMQDEATTLIVTDDGPGIPDEHRLRVFEPMTTLKSRDIVEGSGMGLAIVQKIARVYGAKIAWLKTEGGRGTSIAITFPALSFAQINKPKIPGARDSELSKTADIGFDAS